MRLIYVALFCLVLFACGKKEKESVADQPTPPVTAADSTVIAPTSSYSYQIIAAPEHTFGYDVFKDSALFIHQPHIPGMPGVKGFLKEEQATKAATLMIEKMKNGVVPPTLSEEEVNAIVK